MPIQRQRPTGHRRQRARVVVVSEGSVTEPTYINKLMKLWPDIAFTAVKHGMRSAPNQLVQAMKKELAQNPLQAADSAWIILDTDTWTAPQINLIRQWRSQDRRHVVGMSNPNFEYWVLLHFESGADVRTPEQVSRALQRHLPKHTKHLEGLVLTRELVQRAATHARNRHKAHDTDALPPPAGNTTMYLLVEGLDAIGP
jgi:hypothetical protein